MGNVDCQYQGPGEALFNKCHRSKIQMQAIIVAFRSAEWAVFIAVQGQGFKLHFCSQQIFQAMKVLSPLSFTTGQSHVFS